ncbi:hypothetical protein Tco_0196288 [Tanacetum coccineum]
MLLYSWDGGLDVCVDLTGSSPLTQTGMVDFVPGRVMIDAAQRKRSKYMAKCAAIGYGFLLFSFSSLGELEADAVTLLKRIRKFSMTQDIGARKPFNTTGTRQLLFVTTCTSAPQMMKNLAKCYFGVIEKDLVSKYSLSPRHVSILSCIRAPHAQDFLFTIPIDGLGQRMNHRQFHSVLCYRLSVPMFFEGSLCPSCNAHRMDQWGAHAVDCSSEVGVKFRHNLVRDILVDICSKVGIMVRKEAPMGFLSDDGKDLRPSDLLLFNWLQGKDACLDVTCISPFAGMGGLCLWLLGIAMHNAGREEKEEVCVNMRGKRIQVHTICFLYVRGIRHGGFGHTFPY